MLENESFFRGFYKLSRKERLRKIQLFCGLSEHDAKVLSGEVPIDPALAENFIENVIGYYPMPLGAATNFNIDGTDMIIPMAVEETSIIAAASATAKWVKEHGTIRTHSKGKLIIGQIQFPSVKNTARLREVVHSNRKELIDRANYFVPGLVRRGGGVRDISVRELSRGDGDGDMVVIHVHCDPCDAMGANLINQVCEGLKPALEELTGEKIGICILSNLVEGCLSVAEVIVRNVNPGIGKGIEEATLFAKLDPFRATTHNKGVLNGIDPILIATGNDWRAVEAAIHAYAARSGRYQPITEWKMDGADLVGRMEAPIAVGVVGGVTKSHPVSQVVLKMLNVKSSEELARICVAVGLVQNLAALKALSTVGIVKGHMRLHAGNLAYAVGANIEELPTVRERLALLLKQEKKIDMSMARDVLAEIRGQSSDGSRSNQFSIN